MKRNIVRQIYFYAASLITLIIMVISGGQIVNTLLKATLFPKADRAYRASCDEKGFRHYGNEPVPFPEKVPTASEEKAQSPTLTEEEKAELKARCEENLAEERSAERQRDLVKNLSMLLVSAPVFWFHFRIAQREREEERERQEKAT